MNGCDSISPSCRVLYSGFCSGQFVISGSGSVFNVVSSDFQWEMSFVFPAIFSNSVL